MALNSPSAISLGGSTTGQSVAVELGQSATGQISLNDTAVIHCTGVPGSSRDFFINCLAHHPADMTAAIEAIKLKYPK